jgi:type IV pilus assembly protein PilM
VSGNYNPSRRPRLACEVTSAGVVAARAAEDSSALEVYAARALPAGAVAPHLTHGNVQRPEELRQAIAAALEPLARRGRDVIAVLPDAAVRVVLLDFDALPEKSQEAEAVVRFRLKKSLPFDVERAAVSYDVQRANGELRVVAAVALASVIEEYESAFRDAGFLPGVVLPSTLAALGLASSAQPTLVVKVDGGATTISILDQERLLLFRTIETDGGLPLDGERLAEEVYPSVVFFTDTFGAALQRMLVAGADPALVGPALEAQTGARVTTLLEPARIGQSLGGSDAPAWALAAVAGALLD